MGELIYFMLFKVYPPKENDKNYQKFIDNKINSIDDKNLLNLLGQIFKNEDFSLNDYFNHSFFYYN